MMEDINLNGTANGGNSSSDDEVVVGEDDEFSGSKDSNNATSSSDAKIINGSNGGSLESSGNLDQESETASASHSYNLGFSRFDTPDSEDLFGDRPLPEWFGWGEASDLQVGGSSVNPFVDSESDSPNVDISSQNESVTPGESSPSSVDTGLPNGSPTTTGSGEGSPGDVGQRNVAVPSLFEEDVEFVGVELEGTEKAMEQALKEGIVGEAGPLKRNVSPKVQEKENSDEGGPGMKEFNDANYWRVDQEVAVLE